MSGAAGWRWEHREGRAADLHDPSPPDRAGRTVWDMRVSEPTFVLGSSQHAGEVDRDAATAAGITLARRRSGGGAVLLVPGEHLWFDLWLPAADPLWVDDVGRAGDWLAAVWVSALQGMGMRDLEVFTGRLDPGPWGQAVCFAGLGPAEVTAGGRKLVGISQRRTREWARFQCLVHSRWDADATFGLISRPGATEAAIEWRDRVAVVEPARMIACFVDALTTSGPDARV